MDEEEGAGGKRQPAEQQQPQLVLRKSCDYCARMKRACDGGSPCALCCRRGKTCERRLRRKSGPAKGAKYAPRRRKLDDEVALTEEEAAAAVAAVAATRERRCGTTTTGANEETPDRNHGGRSSWDEPMPATATAGKRAWRGKEEEQEEVAAEEEAEREAQASSTQRRRGSRGGGWWAEEEEGSGKRGSRCSDSSSGRGGSGAAHFFPASPPRNLPHKRDFSSTGGGVEAVAAPRGGGERIFVSPGRDWERCGSSSNSSSSSSNVTGHPLSGGGGGGGGAPGRSCGSSNSSGRGGSSDGGVAAPSSPPSLPTVPSSACTSYSSRGSVGRLVLASPSRGAGTRNGTGVGGGRGGHWQAREGAGGEVASRAQAIEPSVRRASGEVGFNFRPHPEGAAAERSPHGGGGGGGQSPGGHQQQQPLAPRDLLLMLRPNDDGMIDIIDDNDERRSSASMAVRAVGGGGYAGGDADRRRSWSKESRTCAKEGVVLGETRRGSTAAAAAAAGEEPPGASGGSSEQYAEAPPRSSPAYDRSRGCGGGGGGDDDDDAAAPAERCLGWRLGSAAEGYYPWRAGRGGGPLPAAGRRGSGAGFAFADEVRAGEQVHRGGGGGWPERAGVTETLYVGGGGGGVGGEGAEYGHGHGGHSSSGYGSTLPYHPPPHGDGDHGGGGGGGGGESGTVWHSDGDRSSESARFPALAAWGGGHPDHHHHHHHVPDHASHPRQRSHFTPCHEAYYRPRHAPRREYLLHRSAATAVLTRDESGSGGHDGGRGVRAKAYLSSVGGWGSAERISAARYAEFFPADAQPLHPSSGTHGGRDCGDGGNDSSGGGKPDFSAGGYWSGGTWSARPAPRGVRFSSGDDKIIGDDAPWHVRSDGPFRKRGKMAHS